MEQDSPKANNSDWIKPKKLSKETFKLGEIIGKGIYYYKYENKEDLVMFMLEKI